MEISEETAKMRLHRARAYVRNALEKYFRSTPTPPAVAAVSHRRLGVRKLCFHFVRRQSRRTPKQEE